MSTASAGDRVGGIDPTLSLLLWLVVQLAALLLASGRVRLSAGFAVQGLAVDEMLIVQFVLSGMLFPILLRDLWTSLAILLTGAPMLQLAGVLSRISWHDLVLAWCCLGLWLAALGIRRLSLRDREAQATSTTACPSRVAQSTGRLGWTIALVNFISLGGLQLWYLECEFGGSAEVSHFFPLPALLLAVHGEVGFGLPLSSTGVILIASGAFHAVRQVIRKR